MDRRAAWFLGTAAGTLVAGSFFDAAPPGANISLSFAGWCFLLLPAALVLGLVKAPKAVGAAAGLVAGGFLAAVFEGSDAMGLATGVAIAGLLALALRYGIAAVKNVESRPETHRITTAV